jgi:hypothetical protein
MFAAAATPSLKIGGETATANIEDNEEEEED